MPQDSIQNRGPIIPKKGEKERNFIWTKNGQVIRKNEVKTGANDGINYELISGLNEGEEIVLSMTVQKATDAKKAVARSPFMPQRPGQKK